MRNLNSIVRCLLLLLLLSLSACSSLARESEMLDEGPRTDDPIAGYFRNVAGSEEEIPPIELGTEYADYNRSTHGSVNRARDEHSTFEAIVLYIPNRMLDLIDVVKADVGIGPATGVVLRGTKFVQAGLRAVAPFSLRLGARGRYLPLWLESSSEIGVSPAFRQSSDRVVGAGEFGAGVDLLLVGAYLGVDFLELGDFILGLFTIDLKEDDL